MAFQLSFGVEGMEAVGFTTTPGGGVRVTLAFTDRAPPRPRGALDVAASAEFAEALAGRLSERAVQAARHWHQLTGCAAEADEEVEKAELALAKAKSAVAARLEHGAAGLRQELVALKAEEAFKAEHLRQAREVAEPLARRRDEAGRGAVVDYRHAWLARHSAEKAKAQAEYDRALKELDAAAPLVGRLFAAHHLLQDFLHGGHEPPTITAEQLAELAGVEAEAASSPQPA